MPRRNSRKQCKTLSRKTLTRKSTLRSMYVPSLSHKLRLLSICEGIPWVTCQKLEISAHESCLRSLHVFISMLDYRSWTVVQEHRSRESTRKWYVASIRNCNFYFFSNPSSGVYFSKEGSVSIGYYAGSSTSYWSKSTIRPTKCVAVAELVNLPSKFIAQKPYFVIDKTDWILW